MSQIFDALQRAEAERSGGESSPLLAADILRRAERLAATKWENQSLLGERDGIKIDDLASPVSLTDSTSYADSHTATTLAEPAKSD